MYPVVVHNSAGVPQIVPLVAPKERPSGKVALISQEVISPEPVMVGEWQVTACSVVGAARRIGNRGQLINYGDVEIGYA